jgi:hypothetical protein
MVAWYVTEDVMAKPFWQVSEVSPEPQESPKTGGLRGLKRRLPLLRPEYACFALTYGCYRNSRIPELLSFKLNLMICPKHTN